MQPAEFRFDLREASGVLGDPGTLLPLMLGTIAVVGLAPMPIVLGFGVAYARPRSIPSAPATSGTVTAPGFARKE